MTQVADQRPSEAGVETDLVAAVRRVLQDSSEPLTLSKIRALLPAAHRGISLEDLAESLRRQVAANVLVQYPKYRSQQDRFWDRPMPVHVACLLRTTLEESPLAWSELRRKLPAYALTHAETVLQEQLAQGLLHRHPRVSSRGKERFGAAPPDPRDYLRDELGILFGRLEQLGFTRSQLRAGALELLHDEEWTPTPPPARQEQHRPAERQQDESSGRPAQPESRAPEASAAPSSPGGGQHPGGSEQRLF